MGSKQGVMKIAAKRIGLTLDEYTARIAAGLKWCTTCKAWHPVADFGRDDSRGDGLASYCIDSRIKLSDRPGTTERRRQRSKGLAWCHDCHDWLPIVEIKSGKCKTHHAAYERQRYATDVRYRAERRQHAHSRKRNVAPVPLIGQEYRLDMTEGRCAYCGNSADTWDHVIPVSQGGQTVADNILPACGTCNSSKGDGNVWEWLGRTGRKPREETMVWLALYHHDTLS